MTRTFLKAMILLAASQIIPGTAVLANVPFAFFKAPAQAESTPVKLAFTTQPSWSNMAGVDLYTQPVVSIQDVNGNTVTAATHTVTLAAFKDSACTAATTTGTLSVTTNPLAASSGVATFSGVDFSFAGKIYLKATASGLTSACSTLVTLNDSPGTITYVNSFTGFSTSASCATTTVSTTVPNELLFAHVFEYSICSGSRTVSGAGLTWAKVTNMGGATFYSAWAVAPTVLTNQTISYCNCSNTDGRTLIVSTYKNTDVNSPVGRVVTGNQGSNTAPSVVVDTVRNNSLVISELNANSGATLAATGTTTLNATVTANKISGSGRQSSITATKGTNVTSSYSSTLNNSTSVLGIELQTYLTPITTPTLDRVWTADNGSGQNYAFTFDTEEPNELLLLAVTWRSATPLPQAPTVQGQSMTPVTTVSQGASVTTQIFSYMPSSQMRANGGGNASQIYIYMPDTTTKSTAVLAAFRGVNISGTQGSGAIDAIQTTAGATANPTNNLATTTNNSLVVSFLGYAKDGTGLAAGSGFTLGGSSTSSGGGSASTKSTTAVQIGNSLVASPNTVSVPWTLPAVDWTKVDIVIKP